MRVRLWILTALAAITLLAAAPPLGWTRASAAQPAVKDQGAIPGSQIPGYITAAVNSPDRPAADKAIDPSRKPAQVMAFFGIRPAMKVADLSAGGGWTTGLLALIVGPGGKVYSQNDPAWMKRFAKGAQQWRQRLTQPALKNVVAVEQSFDSPTLLPVKADSLDALIVNMNYHDLVGHGVNLEQFNRYVYRVLKPGGTYAIIDNSAQAGSGSRDVSTLHRIDEAYVLEQVAVAGFRLAAASGVLRNPKDDRAWFFGKYRGQQDRFMLKFVKPLPGHGRNGR